MIEKKELDKKIISFMDEWDFILESGWTFMKMFIVIVTLNVIYSKVDVSSTTNIILIVISILSTLHIAWTYIRKRLIKFGDLDG